MPRSACEIWPLNDFMFPCLCSLVANMSPHRLADSPLRATETIGWLGNYQFASHSAAKTQ